MTEPQTMALPDVTLPVGDGQLKGAGVSPAVVANSVLRRSFLEYEPLNSMKLQRLMYFIACLYQRESGFVLLSEQFQPWEYGPALASIHEEFKSFDGKDITVYAKDANGRARMVRESANPAFRRAITVVWDNLSGYTAVDLSRLTHRKGSAWHEAWTYHMPFISNESMAQDDSFFNEIGWVRQ